MIFRLMLVFLLALSLGRPTMAQEEPSFAVWLEGLKADALARGVSPATFDAALSGVEPVARIIELDRRQPEFTQTFWAYMDARVTQERVDRGRALLTSHRRLLDRVAAEFNVQPHFLVAFWGLETNFGGTFGGFSAASALATLAHDQRRSGFFREQLLALLVLMEKGDIPLDAKASWAGAMGHVQFMPTTYRDFAVDFDDDGRRDLWGSLPDAFASAASYLSRSGWKGDQTWGREVRLPQGFDWEQAGMDKRKPLAEWQKLGVRRMDGTDLPKVDMEGSLILPSGHAGPAFLVYDNFRTILVWNRSLLYAISVGHLADRISGAGRLTSPRPKNEVALSRSDVVELQELLAKRGFYGDEADGVVGPRTRDAIRAFQKAAKLPVDGHADFGLLERLRGTGNGG